MSPFERVERSSLTAQLARRIRSSIQSGEYHLGDRLPPISELARHFGVGQPTIREALTKLEATGVLEIRHGSGVYVSRSEETLVMVSPDYNGALSRKLLVDLIHTRTPLELQAAAGAVQNASDADLAEMRRLLHVAEANLANDDVLHSANMGFHQELARASGNAVLAQLLTVLHDLFVHEQRIILDIFALREQDHAEHLGILEAVASRDQALAVARMQAHLDGVRAAIEQWNPDDHPVH